MAEEAKATQSEQAKAEVIPRSPAEMGAEMLPNEAESKESHDFGGLFSDEARPSEEELSGEEKAEKPSEKKDEVKPKSEAAPPKPEGEKPKEEPKKKAEEEKVEEKPKEEAKKPEKPPEGFVPKEALAQSRANERKLKEELARVKAQLEAKPAEKQVQKPAEDAKWEKFKVLSDEEYDQMVEDDPIEAQKYSHRLRQFERYQEQKSAAQKEAQQSKAKMQTLVDQTVAEIREAVPGIYDEDSSIRTELAEFAVKHGFDDDAYLDAMTNPATLIVPPGQDKSFLIGPGAKSLIKLLHTLRAKVSNASDPAKLKEEVTKELEPKLREAITKELVAKFKGAGPEKFKSLSEVPGSGEKPESSTPLTEEQWAKLSPEDREKYLQAT